MIWRCDLIPQYERFQHDIARAIERVLRSGRYILGDEVAAFEREFAQYLGVRHAIGVANGTDALTLSLIVAGAGPGTEVITTPFTAIPTVSAIVDAGATPVFVDVDPETYLIDLDAAAAAVTHRTRAVLPVHIFGNVVDVPELRRRIGPDIAIVEDACQAHGSLLRGRRAGSLGDLATFSFYPTKNLGGYGDGGAIVTDDDQLAEKLRLLRMYGMTDKDHIVIHGINSRLDELQAAILRVKLRCLDEMNQRRNQIAERYRAELSHLCRFQRIADGATSNYHVLAARVPSGRDALAAFAESQGIQTNVYYVLPLHLQEATRALGMSRGDLPVVEALCDEVIALPMYAELPDDLLEDILRRLKNVEFRGLQPAIHA